MENQSKDSDKKFEIVIGSSRDIILDHKDPKADIKNDFLLRGEKLSPYNEEILGIIKTLRKNGYDVKFLNRGEMDSLTDYWVQHSPVFYEKARELGARGETFSVPDFLGQNRNPVFNWLYNASEKPRDSFIQLNNVIYLNSDYYPLPINEKSHQGYLSRLEWLIPNMPEDAKLDLLLKRSPFGEGGKVIPFKDFVLVSSKMRKRDRSRKRLEGKKIYFVNPLFTETKTNIISENARGHIDYHVNGISFADYNLVVVDPFFYEQNSETFKDIQRNHPINIVFIDKDERGLIPANFLVIPDGKILMAAGTEKTQKTLEQEIGGENLLVTEKPLPSLLKSGYGVRCISNIICS